MQVLDLHGNPVTVSGIVTYYVKNSKRAALDVEHYAVPITTNTATPLLQS